MEPERSLLQETCLKVIHLYSHIVIISEWQINFFLYFFKRERTWAIFINQTNLHKQLFKSAELQKCLVDWQDLGSIHFQKKFFCLEYSATFASEDHFRRIIIGEGEEEMKSLSPSHIIHHSWIVLMPYQCSRIKSGVLVPEDSYIYLWSYWVSWNWDQRFQILHMPLCDKGSRLLEMTRACAGAGRSYKGGEASWAEWRWLVGRGIRW